MLPVASARSADAAHRLRTAQGARARPRARRPRRRAREHRRVHRDHQGRADAADREAGADGEIVGFVARARHAHARGNRERGGRRARRVPSGGPESGVRDAGRRPVPAVRHAGAGNPPDAPAAPHGPRAGQDHRRISRRDGADRRSARHSRAARADHDADRRRTDAGEGGVRRCAPLEDRAERDRAEHRRPDHAAGHGGHDVARGLREVAAAVRVPCAKSAAAAASRRRR
ncbi:DNA gyrase, A subunit domain protein [Burkholderia mallei]|nr:DNA gyrase, A subunit domain protein [Burkholderia mallei]